MSSPPHQAIKQKNQFWLNLMVYIYLLVWHDLKICDYNSTPTAKSKQNEKFYWKKKLLVKQPTT